MKKFLVWLFSIISIISFIYYTGKVYTNKSLNFTKNSLIIWTIIVVLTTICVCLGLYNMYLLDTLKRQNEELKTLIINLSNQSEEQYDSTCHHLQNNREIELDIFNELQERNGDK